MCIFCLDVLSSDEVRTHDLNLAIEPVHSSMTLAYYIFYIYTHTIARVSLFDSSHSQNDYNNYFIRRGSGPLCLSILKVITRCLYCPSGTASTVFPFWLCYTTV